MMMHITKKFSRVVKNNKGMTLVEVMVAMIIVAIIADIVYNVSLSQMRSVNEGGSVLESAGSPTTGIELMKRDLSLAGYGTLDMLDTEHQKNIALFVKDGGNGVSAKADKLFLFDGSYIDISELSYDFYGELGHATITAGAGTTSITLDRLDLDSSSPNDDTYGATADPKEFAGSIWQYVITNSSNPSKKVAKINSIAAKTLTLDAAVDGTMLGPAVYYCVDSDGTDTSCHPTGNSLNRVLRRSSRISGGRQPVAENIVDMQIAYKVGTTWYCDGAGTCPLNPFYAGTVDLIRISLIARIGPSTSTATVSMENGPNWGNDGNAYQVFTTSVRPRNNIEFK